MNKSKAKSVLVMLDKINKEIDLLGRILISKPLKPVPVRVKVHHPNKLK